MEEYLIAVNNSVSVYQRMVEDGVCPEQARFVLPQGAMVNWIWTGSLLAYARFYNLRSKPDAQVEVQQVAKLVGEHLQDLFPESWKALTTPHGKWISFEEAEELEELRSRMKGLENED